MCEHDDELARALEGYIPKSLDDIIRKHREAVRLRPTREEELQSLARTIVDDRTPPCVDDWRFVTLDVLILSASRVRLLGELATTGESWCTSNVQGIDFERGLVRTDNSLYRLGERGKGEPPFGQLAALCASLHRQGVGEQFGIPHFFF